MVPSRMCNKAFGRCLTGSPPAASYALSERASGVSHPFSKPVDLQVSWASDPSKAIVAIEVANVNTTQLVGETCRLYYDSCPLKLLILGDRNVPSDGRQQCEKLLARLYG